MFEGDRQQFFRMLRAIKNRYGSTSELALFAMAGEGLEPVPDPSRMLLAERPHHASGSAVVATIEGSRPLLVEVQALLVRTGGHPRRVISGMEPNRVALVLAVLERHLGLAVGEMDAYFKLTGGVSVQDPALDLGVAAAAVSSLSNRPIDANIVVMGEVGLTGEIRRVPRLHDRLAEARGLGFQTAICPAGEGGGEKGLTVRAVERLDQAMRELGLD